MSLVDYFKYAWENIMHRKVRSFLSIVSIMIGITAIFALMSFGLGLNQYINSQFEEIGGNKLIIQPKGFSSPGEIGSVQLNKKDVDFLKKINGLDVVTPMQFRSVQIESHRQQASAYIAGLSVEPDEKRLVDEVFGVEIMKGRELRDGDRLKAVAGYNYQLENKVFTKSLDLREKITVNEKKIEIIGFYDEVGNPEDDKNIYLTIDGYEELFPEDKNYEMILMSVENGRSIDQMKEIVNERFRKERGQKEGEEDYSIQTFDDIIQSFTTILNILNGLLIAIVLISVLVATVNIMNTMYTAVLERTKEIGVMKAIGARNTTILSIFMLEAGFLGTIGAAGGILVGWLISIVGGSIAKASGFALLQPVFPWYLILGCLLFGFGVGATAGLLPALQASKLRPVDSLRYE